MIGDPAVNSLVNALANRSQLKLLDFSKELSLSVGHNHITDEGAKSISSIIANLNNLTVIHIGTY